jgi:hypothetical protein
VGKPLSDFPATGQEDQAFTVVIKATGIVDGSTLLQVGWKQLEYG